MISIIDKRARWLAQLLSFVAVLAPLSAAAQVAPPFPTRALTYVVGFSPGGPPDLVARVMAPALAGALGKPVVVENRVGGSGTIAFASAARSEADGHTLVSADHSLVLSPFVVPNLTYDPLRDFKFVAQVARTEQMLVVDPRTSIRSVADLVAAARKEPGSIKAAHTGIGAPPYLGLVAFMRATDTSFLLVPYKGSAPAIQDVVAGHITLLATGPSTSVELAQAGKVRILATTGTRRLPEAPEVPTYTEVGIDMGGLKEGQFFGIAVAAGTPAAVVAQLNAAVRSAMLDPAVQQQLRKIYFTPVTGSTTEAFTAFIKEQSAYWGQTMPGGGAKR